ncbi:MAG: hypothetical protein ACI3WR_00065 [Oscillospiraceae bacterium]
MLQLIRKDWRRCVENSAVVLSLALFGGAVGALMLRLLMAGDEVRWLPLGTLVSLASLLMAMVVFLSAVLSTQYQLALSMGQRRRDYIGAQLLYTFLTALAGWGVAWLIYQAEKLAYPRFYPWTEGMEADVGMAVIFSWQMALGAAIAATVASFFVGALCARYGKKAGVTLYILFLACCLGAPRLAEYIDSESNNLISRVWFWLAGLPAGALLALAAAVLLGMLLFAVHAAMGQEVRL